MRQFLNYSFRQMHFFKTSAEPTENQSGECCIRVTGEKLWNTFAEDLWRRTSIHSLLGCILIAFDVVIQRSFDKKGGFPQERFRS